MTDGIPLSREMLKNPIDVHLPDTPLDFSRARTIADQRAREAGGKPMLLAWYQGATGKFSPKVPCCGDDRPGWLIYAESRGGDLVIDINHEAYVFVYRRDNPEDMINL